MAIVPFTRSRRRRPRAPIPSSDRFRVMIDRYQCLALSKPLVATWLLEWLELFIGRHLD